MQLFGRDLTMNIKRQLYQIIFFLALFVAVTNKLTIAQDKIDSLNTAIENEHEIDKKANLFLILSLEYKSTDLNNSEKFARQALLLVEKSENEKVAGLLHAHLGDIAFLQDSLSKAEKEYGYAVPLLNESGEFHRLILYI